MNKLVNSVRYWSGKLAKAQKDNNVIIGLYNSSKNVSISFLEVLDALGALGMGSKLRGFNSFRNPRFMNFVFDSKETREIVKKLLRRIGDNNVVYLDWGSTNACVTVKAHWVPLDLPVEKNISVLSKYVKVISYIKESLNSLDGRSFPNGTIAFKTELMPNVDIKNIPHLCEVDGLEILINITGRKILCLNCGLLGHKSSECPTPFCSRCKRKMVKSHECIGTAGGPQTYAQAASTSGLPTEEEAEGVFMQTNPEKSISMLSEENILKAKEGRDFWLTNKVSKNDSIEGGSLEVGDSGVSEGGRKSCWAEEHGDDHRQFEADKDSSDKDLSEAEQNLLYIKELEKLKQESAQCQNQIRSLVETGDNCPTDLNAINPMEIDIGTFQQKRKLEDGKQTDVLQKVRQTTDNLSISNPGLMKNYSKKGGGG